jgi:hypothetical protein
MVVGFEGDEPIHHFVEAELAYHGLHSLDPMNAFPLLLARRRGGTYYEK